jgi:hypothetical protein
MRQILAVASTALLVSVAMSTVVFAQKKTTDAARASRAEARGSLNDSYNRCVSLARSRGFTDSDVGGKSSPARKFVIGCMQGKQR